ncbi:MAG: ASCH domain-containing protein [Acidobacteriota bacterium]|nr:ASCH domain-containing protein [Acidobacteriota bacterium]
MSKTDLTEKFWQEFRAKNPDVNADEPYQVWYFGNTSEMAKELVALVLQGKKTATASLFWEYENKREDEPIVDGYSVVTDFESNPMCVLRTTELRVLPFNEVDEQFAFDEGEGDQSLDYWREVHWDYFSRRCIEIHKEPSNTMIINCERFKLLYPKSSPTE